MNSEIDLDLYMFTCFYTLIKKKLTELRFNPLDDEIKEALAEVNLTLGGCNYYDEDQFFNHVLRNSIAHYVGRSVCLSVHLSVV